MESKPINRESDPRWDRLQQYVNKCAKLMGIGPGWKISVCCDIKEGFEESLSCITMPYSAAWYEIRFGDRFFLLGRDEQRATVVHELLHAVLAGVHAIVDRDILTDEHFSGRDIRLFNTQFDAAIDVAVERIALVMAPLFPFPDLGDGDEDVPEEARLCAGAAVESQ